MNPESDDKTSGRQRADIAKSQGSWGEAVAADFLRRRGWQVLAMNVRPCKRDLRCEIDLVVKSACGNIIVFVEVKTHKAHSDRATRLWSIDRRKKQNLLRACTNWILHERWHGNFRFDVIEVYGQPGVEPEIDYIENVPLFPSKWRFW